MESSKASIAKGNLTVAYADVDGQSVGVRISSVESSEATMIFTACSSALGGRETKFVTSHPLAHNDITSNGHDGGDNMEKRIAVLEAEVSHIKSDVAEMKVDVKKASTDTANIQKDVAVMLQKIVDIDTALSKKPSTSDMTAAIASAANKQIVWTIGIAIAVLGLAKYMF